MSSAPTSPNPTSTPSDSETPLAGTNPDSISELFARDPLAWTEADVTRMIEHFRKARLTFDQSPPKAKAKPAKAPPLDTSGMSGGDLLDALGL